MKRLTVICCACLGLARAAVAQAPFEPETLTVQATIAPGANVFVAESGWMGVSRINVLGADDLAMKGDITPGLQAQVALSADGRTLYTASNYPRRIVFGPTESVVHEWDVATMKLKREIAVPAKLAMVETQPAMLALADGGRFLLAQNATPASSVEVVDLGKGAPVAEVPTPGCWGAIPAATGAAFLGLCGDGSIQTWSLAADGSFSAPKKVAGVFDPDKDALFTNPARDGDDLLFMSFGGNILRVSFRDGVATVGERFSITAGAAGWAPGGSEVIAYHPGTGVAFVLMHPDAAEGSHKDPAEEIWSVDVANRKVLYRSHADEETSITVSKSTPPVVYALTEAGTLNRYEIDPEAKSAAKPAGRAENMGSFVALALTDK